MADNMIELVAQLNTVESTKVIQSQINTMQKDLSLKIRCDIDSNSIKVLQSKLSGITGGAINIDSRVANSSLRAIAEGSDGASAKVRELTNSLADLESKYSKPIRAVIDNEGFVKAEETMAKLKEQLSSLGAVEVSGVYGDRFGVNKLEKMVATIKSQYGELRTMTFELGDNDLFRFLSGKFDERGVQKQTEEINKFVDNYITKLNSLKAKVGENFALNISATVGDDLNKTIVTFQTFENKLLELRNGKGSIEEIRAEFVALDGTVKNLGSLLRGGDSSLNQFTNATNNARNFTNELKALEVEYENLSTATRSDSLFNSLADAQQKLVDLQKTQSTEGYTANWIRQYQELSVAIRQATEDVKLAKKLEQQDASSATKKQANALRDVATAYREINQYTKTLYSTSATDVEKGLAGAHRGDQYALVEQIKQRLESEGLLDDVLKREIQNYEAIAKEIELIAKSRRDAVQAHREEVEAGKAERQNLQDVNKLIKENLSALEKFNNSTVAKNNASNPTVVSQTGLNADLINQLRGLQDSLANDKSLENIARITGRMNELSNALRDAKFNSSALDQSLRDNSVANKFNAKLNSITNQIEIFANENKKATESLKLMRNGTTFADEWQRIVTLLKSGNLDNNAIQKLTQDFRDFKGQAQSVGLVTNRFFTSMQSQLRMVLQRWISLYAVISYIRKIVDGVKELDTAMINMRRVTEATSAEYSKFLTDANQRARELKTTTSSLIEQAYQWAKLGYDMNEALTLAQSSTIFAKVADVDQEQAVNNLITVMKAFNIEVEHTIDVVDKLDKLNNEYAVSAAGLGEGLERSASTMAMTGNSLEQALALLTGTGEITQNLENTGNALRVVALRIQGMKGKLEELEEPVDDLVEVSKVQTQILNLTKNQVDIYDKGTENFRSTYDIMKDISEVWDTLSATNRASLTEILFGKNRANIGLAVIQAFQSGQIEKAYIDAMDASGTATEEYERMMEGVQAQFSALAGQAQEFANSIMSSNFLKFVISGATQILKILTLIVDKVGTLPTILATIAGISYFKTSTNVFAGLIASLKGVEIQAIASKVALTSLQAAATAGIAIGVTWVVSKITKWVNKEKEAEKAAKEATKAMEERRKATAESAKSYDSEEKNLTNLLAQYVSLAASVTDINNKRAELLELQDKIVDAYGSEADSIDLVNKGVEENIRLMSEAINKRKVQWTAENYDAIQQAQKALGISEIGGRTSIVGRAYDLNQTSKGEYATEAKIFTDTVKEYLQTHFPDMMKDIWTESVESIEFDDYEKFYNSRTRFGIAEGVTAQRAAEIATAITEAYEEAFRLRSKQANFEKLDQETIMKTMYAWQQRITEYSSILSQAEQLNGEFDNWSLLKQNETDYNNFIQLQERAIELNRIINDSNATIAERQKAYWQLDQVSASLDEIARKYPSVSEQIGQELSKLGMTFNSTTNTVELAKETWTKSFDETQKGVIASVDKITSAMKKLYAGEALDEKSAWEIINLDDNKLLSNIQIDENGEYILDLKQIITLKDELIAKEIEQRKASIETAKVERNLAESAIKTDKASMESLEKRMSDIRRQLSGGLPTYVAEGLNTELRDLETRYLKLESKVEDNTSAVDAYNYAISRESLLVEALTKRTGDLTETSEMLQAIVERLKKEVSELEKEAEARLKAQEVAIDQIIQTEENRLNALEKEKDTLDEQLDVLEKQQDELQEIIDNYEKIAGVVNSTIQSQIDEIEKERKAVEDSYNERINLLKQENEERSDAIEYQQKLAALENARNNKKRIYDQERGFIYSANADAVANAENDLANFENEQLIKSIEKDRDETLKVYDTKKSDLEDYAKLWEEVVNSITDAEDELFATQILGSNWREKIAKKDTSILNKFKSDYASYNNQLKNIVNTEIDNIKKAVSAKDEEIKAKQAQINAWKDYKTEVQNTASTIKNGLEDYVKYLGDVQLSENSTNQQRINNLTNFANTYSDLIAQITSKNSDIELATQKIEALSKAGEGLRQGSASGIGGVSNIGEGLSAGITSILDSLSQAVKDIMDKTKDLITGGIGAFGRLTAFANGGVNTKTGIAWLDGTPNRPELILNNTDASKLYNMLHAMPTTAINSALFRGANTTGNSSTVFNIQHMDINGVQNPVEFAREFKKNINEYWNTKLTESKVY